MDIPIPYLLAIAAAPLLLLLAGSRLTKRTVSVFAITMLVTWIATTIFYTWLMEGVDDIAAIVLALLVYTPAVGVVVATSISRFALKAPVLAALVFACQGWFVGLFLFAITANPQSCDGDGIWNWYDAYLTAIPATWAALGSAVAGNLKWRWQT